MSGNGKAHHSVSKEQDACRVALIIVNYNGSATLMQCLDSVSKQTLVPSRVIVIDNASTDGSATIAAKVYTNFTFVFFEKNTGFAAANNYAAKIGEDCDWLALLNPDAFPEPDWLECLCSSARNNPAFGFFGSRMLMRNDLARLDGVGDIYHISGLAWREGHGAVAAGYADKPKEIFAPCAAAALYRRADFWSVGGFDEDFFCYMEDVDLGFRLRLLGHRCLYVSDAVVHHVGSASSGGKHSGFSVFHGHRNLVWVFIKNMPGLLIWFLMPVHLLINMISVVWFVLRGQGKTILHAKAEALRGLPRMLKKRKHIQRSRTITNAALFNMLDTRLISFRRISKN